MLGQLQHSARRPLEPASRNLLASMALLLSLSFILDDLVSFSPLIILALRMKEPGGGLISLSVLHLNGPAFLVLCPLD